MRESSEQERRSVTKIDSSFKEKFAAKIANKCKAKEGAIPSESSKLIVLIDNEDYDLSFLICTHKFI